MKKRIALLFVVVLIMSGLYCYRFYPQQQMPEGKPVFVATPEFENTIMIVYIHVFVD